MNNKTKEQLIAEIAELKAEKIAYKTHDWYDRVMLEFNVKHLRKRHRITTKTSPPPA